MSLRHGQEGARLGANPGLELRSVWVVEAGEHEVVPDHDPQLVAESEEGGRFVDGHAGNAEHVEAGVARNAEAGRESDGVAGAGAGVEPGPDCAAAEDGRSVDFKAEAGGRITALDRSEADVLKVDGVAANLGRDGAGGGLTVGMRPPTGRIGYHQFRLHFAAVP